MLLPEHAGADMTPVVTMIKCRTNLRLQVVQKFGQPIDPVAQINEIVCMRHSLG